jgi:putative ABC transport system permease protein
MAMIVKPVKARAWMAPYALLYIYRRRLRVHAMQELLAGFGVAVAVALVFAAIVANSSIEGSAREVVHAVIGPANLQLRARDSEGFNEHLLASVEHMPGVKQAAPLLEETATVIGPDGRRSTIDLAGTDLSLAVLDGLAHTLPVSTLAPGGLGLTETSAHELGISSVDVQTGKAPGVTLELRGRAYRMKVAAVLGPEAVGALSQAQIAVMPLARLQHLAGLQGRVTRILVESEPGRQAAVKTRLLAVAGGRLAVAPADQDLTLLHQALRPSDQASEFFAAISALLGFLFALNAILLTIPERRRAIADLRLVGIRRTAIVQMVLFQALCLGLVASLVGLLAGYALSLGAFHQSPGYLAQAFTLGTHTVIGVLPLLLALFGGILATCLASAILLLDLRHGRARDAVYFEDGVPGNALGKRAQQRFALAAGSLLMLTTAAFLLWPPLALPASASLALATVLAVPLVFAGTLRAARTLAERNQRLTILPVAITSLKATTVRALALVITGAVAIFGSVALGGARANLLHGLDNFATAYVADANIWVLNPGDTAGVNSFRAEHYASRIARIPGVESVHLFQSEFMNVGNRRVWIIARPPATDIGLLRSQIVTGNPTVAANHVREGGWVAVSKQIAQEQHVALGGILKLPTPTGIARFRLAAMTTNFGWTAGAVLMNTADYSRFWGTHSPTALGVNLEPGTSLARAQSSIEKVLGSTSGLEAVSASTRAARFDAIAGEGLSRLGEISTMLVIAAILALAAALTSIIWQRRKSLAGLKLAGVKRPQLRRILLMEVALMLGAGCITGAIAGIYGQLVIDSYLKQVTGFPVASAFGGLHTLEILVLVILAVLAIVAVPGWFASRVPAMLALEE